MWKLIPLCVTVNQIAGFLSIDCGGRTNRTDPQTNIQWVTDENFIDSGEITELNVSDTPFYFQSLRVFPNPLNKSCYTLPLTPNFPHLLRIWFGGENYIIKEHPNFKYSIETEEMLSLRNVSTTLLPAEKILVSSGSLLHVCLIRISPADDPFISAIELRTLLQGMYTQAKPSTILHLIARFDIGNNLSVIRLVFTIYSYSGMDWFSLYFFGSDMINCLGIHKTDLIVFGCLTYQKGYKM